MSLYNLSYCTPENIPAEILNYDNPLKQLAVGKSGKLGILQLGLEYNPGSHKTSIKHQYYKVPLCIKRALYLEETFPRWLMFILFPHLEAFYKVIGIELTLHLLIQLNHMLLPKVLLEYTG